MDITKIVQLIDNETLAATHASALAREAATRDGKMGALLMAEQHLQAALDMIAALRRIVTIEGRSVAQ